jgi:hypothetical protein
MVTCTSSLPEKKTPTEAGIQVHNTYLQPQIWGENLRMKCMKSSCLFEGMLIYLVYKDGDYWRGFSAIIDSISFHLFYCDYVIFHLYIDKIIDMVITAVEAGKRAKKTVKRGSERRWKYRTTRPWSTPGSRLTLSAPESLQVYQLQKHSLSQ